MSFNATSSAAVTVKNSGIAPAFVYDSSITYCIYDTHTLSVLAAGLLQDSSRLTAGTPSVGQTLACGLGSFPTFAAQPLSTCWTYLPDVVSVSWYFVSVESVAVWLANGPTYVVTEAAAGCPIICTITASNASGNISSFQYYNGSLQVETLPQGNQNYMFTAQTANTTGSSSLAPINYSGFTAPHAYSNLTETWGFGSGIMPPYWQAVEDLNGNYSGPQGAYLQSQVVMGASGCELMLAPYHVGGFDYAGGLITTRNNFYFTYGRVRYLMQMPACATPTGLWPGCWLLNDYTPSGPNVEIDICEMNLQTNNVYGTLHYNEGTAWPPTYPGYDTTCTPTSFNTFEVVWEPGMISWGLNGTVFNQYVGTDADGASLYLLANLSVSFGSLLGFGGTGGAWDPANDSQLPVSAVLQSVTLYQ